MLIHDSYSTATVDRQVITSSNVGYDGGDNQKSKWTTPYSNMTAVQAEKRLGFRIRSLKGVPVHRIEYSQMQMIEKRTQMAS